MSSRWIWMFALLGAFASATAFGQGWSLAECSEEHAVTWAKRVQLAVTAKPGDPAYLPHVHPLTDEQVVENFLYAHLKAFEGETAALTESHGRLLSALRSKHARFEVVPVANWTPTRCDRRMRNRDYFLIRIFDRHLEQEIGRAALNEMGYVARVSAVKQGETEGFPPFPDKATSPLGGRGLGAFSGHQLVATWGTVRCDVVRPCLAAKKSGVAYLDHDGELFSIDNGPRFSVREQMGNPSAKLGFIQSVETPGRGFVSLGGDVLGTIRSVVVPETD